MTSHLFEVDFMKRALNKTEAREIAARVTRWLNSPEGQQEVTSALAAVEASIAEQKAAQRRRITRRNAELHPFDRPFDC